MNPDDLAKLQVDVWKTTVDVQKHFNDIEWKIRGLALTLLTAILGASAIAVREGTTLYVKFLHLNLKLSVAILMAGLIVWLAFFFVDKSWYHRLLIGSVRYGEALEAQIPEIVSATGLTRTISIASPTTIKLFGRDVAEIHSNQKLVTYYLVIAGLLVALILGAQFGAVVSDPKPAPKLTPTSTTAPPPVTCPCITPTTWPPVTPGDA